MSKFKLDIYLILIFLLIFFVYNITSYSFIIIIPVLLISYYRIIIKKDITTVIILMLVSRLIMGPLLPGNNQMFNVLNFLCNYFPSFYIIIYNCLRPNLIPLKRIKSLRFTMWYAFFLLTFGLFTPQFAIDVFTVEILPILLFLIMILLNQDQKLNYLYLLNFFRYSFLACVVIYLSPFFYENMVHLYSNGIIFKEEVPNIALTVMGVIPRNTGFVFDFRILGQLACLYLLLLYYLHKKTSYKDLILLVVVALTTFSRGPLVILFLLAIAVYLPTHIRLTKRLIVILSFTSAILLGGIFYSLNSEVFQNFLNTFNPTSSHNAISQRGIFIDYSLDKFYENPLGNGIGSLSSSNSGVQVFAGYTNLHKVIPDEVYYYKITDAYLTLSLAEKGIIGFFLFFLSFLEIFLSKINRVSVLFSLGLLINLVGTDIPKEGFYYFVIIFISYGIIQSGGINKYHN